MRRRGTKGSTPAVEVLERLAVIETNWPHLESMVHANRSDLVALKRQMKRIGDYFQIGVTLGLSTMLQLSGAPSADAVIGFLRFLRGLSG